MTNFATLSAYSKDFVEHPHYSSAVEHAEVYGVMSGESVIILGYNDDDIVTEATDESGACQHDMIGQHIDDL